MAVHGPRALQHRPFRSPFRYLCADLCALPVTYRTTTVPRGYPRAAGGSSLGDSSTAAVCRRHRFGAPIRQRDCNRHGQGSCRKVSHHQRPCTGCPCGPRGIDVESNVCCAGLGSARTSTDVSSATSADVRSATSTAVRSALLAERLYATRRAVLRKGALRVGRCVRRWRWRCVRRRRWRWYMAEVGLNRGSAQQTLLWSVRRGPHGRPVRPGGRRLR